MKDGCKLHENFFWLDTVAEACDNLVQLFLIDFFLRVVESLNEPLHDFPEVILVFDREHANEIDNLLHESWKLKVNILNQRYKNVLIIVNQVGIKVFKQNNIPVDNNFTSLCLIGVQNLVLFVASKLILKLLQYILEVILIFHYFKHKLNNAIVDVLYDFLNFRALTIYKDNLNDLWELLLKHDIEELLLLTFNHLVFFREIL